MSTVTASPAAPSTSPQVSPLVMRVLGACALAHLINDLIQAVLPSIYPMLKANYGLSFTQVGLITLTFQLTASLLQPWIGYHTDRHPKPWLLPAGMVCTLVGILMLAFVGNFPAILLAAALVGVGSSTFHPETSRVARLASGGRYGLAQSTFQVGGNTGSAFGPLLAAAIIIPYGQSHIAWFGLFAVFAILVLYGLSRWYRHHLNLFKLKQGSQATHGLSKGRVTFALVVLAVLVFSKYWYMTSLTSYFTFYLIEKFQLSVASSQMYLFLFLGAVAVGTFAGRPHRRQDRPQKSYLVLHPRRRTIHPGPALRRPVLDRRTQRGHRLYHRLGVLRHRGVCPGTGARQCGHDRRDILRPDVRFQWDWRGAARDARRSSRHRVRVQAVLVPAVGGYPHGTVAVDQRRLIGML